MYLEEEELHEVLVAATAITRGESIRKPYIAEQAYGWEWM